MKKTVELRLAELEKRLDHLEKKSRPKKNWRAYVGWAKDDPLYDEAMKLGQKYRQAQK